MFKIKRRKNATVAASNRLKKTSPGHAPRSSTTPAEFPCKVCGR